MRTLHLVAGLATIYPCRASIGLAGIDAWPNKPYCATACYGSLASSRLDCSVVHGDPNDHEAHIETSPDCRADNVPFLTSVAWCIKKRCDDELDAGPSTGDIERFWEQKVTSDPSVPPIWSYRQALANVTAEPTLVLGHGGLINETAVPPDFWYVLYGTYKTLGDEGWNMNVFGLILLNVGFGLPIVLSWARVVPGVSALYARLAPYLIVPSLVRGYNVRPLPFNVGNAPTVGQALYILVMVALNIILTAVNYGTTPAHLWFKSKSQQIAGYMMYRTGVLSFAMAPLVFLFSGRNNFLQWATNWPHSTFMVLHRWVARLFVLQALLHTVLAVGVYSEMGIYSVEAKLPYWAWGVVATLFACVMLVASTLFFRRLSYEVFLLSHIVMAIVVVIGSWYHVVLRFDPLSGYTMWLWTACAVWFFDRLVRVARMLKVGSRRAKVTDIGDGYVRVDVSRVRWGSAPGQKVYMYFPSLNPLRPWENHPFSVLPSSLLLTSPTLTAAVAAAPHAEPRPDSGSEDSPHGADVEKRVPPTSSVAASERTDLASGITLFIRRSSGMTKSLQANEGLYTLLEGPYPSANHSAVLRCDRVLLLAGGIGITGTIPWTAAHHSVRLCWSVKQSAECLVRALDEVLRRVPERSVLVGSRTDVGAVLEEEVAVGWERIGVVACGPGGLCDDVRAAVAAAGRKHKTVFELEVDAYTW